MPLEFAAMTATQLDTLPRARTVFFFPVGPLEDHGPALPVGLDVDSARASCWLIANQLEATTPEWIGVLMPPAPLGLDSNTTRLRIVVRPHVLRDWLVDACRSLERAGFLHFVCISGQLGPKQLTAIEDAGRIVTLGMGSFWLGWLRTAGRQLGLLKGPNATLVSASSGLVSGTQVRQSPFFPNPSEHGGARDGSLALAIYPQVTEQAAALAMLPAIPRRPNGLHRFWLRFRGKLDGYWGDPALASPERGKAVLENDVQTLLPKLRAVWEGANPEFIFRTWYSLIPTNKSFFVAWAFAAAAFSLFLLYMSVQMWEFL